MPAAFTEDRLHDLGLEMMKKQWLFEELSQDSDVSSSVSASGATVHFPAYVPAASGAGGSTTIAAGEEISDWTIGTDQLYALVNISGSAARTTVAAGGSLRVESGGTVSETSVQSGGSLTQNEGSFSSDTEVAGGGTFSIRSGSAERVTLQAGAILVADTGATVLDSSHVLGNFSISSGVADGVLLEGAGASLNVNAGQSAINTVARSGSQIVVAATGTLTNISVEDGVYFILSTDALVSGGMNADGTTFGIDAAHVARGWKLFGRVGTNSGVLTVAAGGTAEETRIMDYGQLAVADGGMAVDSVIYANGSVKLYAGGRTQNTTVEQGGLEWVTDENAGTAQNGAATATGTVVKSGGSQTVDGTGSLATGTVVQAGGTLSVRRGGVAEDFEIQNGGVLSIQNGNIGGAGSLYGNMTISSGALLVEDASLTLQLAGRTGMDAALISNLAGLTVDGTLIAALAADQATGSYRLGGGVLSFDYDVTVAVDGTILGTCNATRKLVNVADAVSYGLSLNAAESTLSLTIGGLDGLVIGTGGDLVALTVAAGRTVADSRVIAGGSLTVSGTTSGTVLEAGEEILLAGGTASGSTLNGVDAIQTVAGGTVSDTLVTAGTLQLQAGLGEMVAVAADGILALSGGVLNGATISGLLQVTGGTATGVVMDSGAKIVAATDSGASVAGTHAGGAFSLANAVASGFLLESGSALTVATGGSALNTTVAGGSLSIQDGSVATGMTISGGTVMVSGGSAADLTMSGGTVIASGGTVSRLTLDGGAVLKLWSGGRVEDVEFGASHVLNATASLTSLSGTYADGAMATIADGTATGLRLGGGSTLDVLTGTSAVGTVLSGGTITVNGGTASDTVVNSGTLVLERGVATEVALNGGMLFLKGGEASGVTLTTGMLNMSDGTFADSVILGGNCTVNGGMVTGTTVQAGARMTVAEATLADMVLASAAGSRFGMVLCGTGTTLSGAWTVDGMLQVAYGVPVSVQSGTSFNFLLSGNVKGTMLSNWDFLTGGADAAYSVTVEETQGNGQYQLIGSTNFREDMTLKDSEGGLLGTFSWADGAYNQIVAGDTRYTLGFQYQALTLQVLRYDEVVVTPGDTATHLDDDAIHGSASNGLSGKLSGTQTYSGSIFGSSGASYATSANFLVDGATLDASTVLYGGAKTASLGSAGIRMESGTIGGYAFGGGLNSNVNNQTTVELVGGTVHNFIGGGRASAGGTANVNMGTELLLDGVSAAAANSTIFGGGYASGTGASALTRQQVSIEAISGQFAYLFGGGHANSGGNADVQAVNLSISGGTFSGYVYGGGRASGTGSSASVLGAVNLTISGGTFRGYVFGGGYGSGGEAAVGSVNLTISGGTFARTVFGGGQRNWNYAAETCSATVQGDIQVTLDLSSGTVNFTDGAGVTTGGAKDTATIGNTTLTLTGTGSNLQSDGGAFTGWLNGSGGVLDATKVHTLEFQNWEDTDFQARIQGFNRLAFSGAETRVVYKRDTRLEDGMDYSFDLSGRSETDAAFWTQGSGSLGLTTGATLEESSVFEVTVHQSDLDLSSGTGGSFLLLDGPAADFSFSQEFSQLTLNFYADDAAAPVTESWVADNWKNVGNLGIEFRLEFDALSGRLSLAWAMASSPGEGELPAAGLGLRSAGGPAGTALAGADIGSEEEKAWGTTDFSLLA